MPTFYGIPDTFLAMLEKFREDDGYRFYFFNENSTLQQYIQLVIPMHIGIFDTLANRIY